MNPTPSRCVFSVFLSLWLALATGISPALAAEGGFSAAPEPRHSLDGDMLLAYFDEVALHNEFSTAGSGQVRKWMRDIRIMALGQPTKEDMQTLHKVAEELDTLTGQAVRVTIVSRDGNMAVHFMPMDRFSETLPQYIPGNEGFFYVYWNRCAIDKATVLIDSSHISQLRRNHLIHEEITQALGLFNDSWRYPESIFFQGITDTQEYAPMDRELITLLYRPQIKPCMTLDQVREILSDTLP